MIYKLKNSICNNIDIQHNIANVKIPMTKVDGLDRSDMLGQLYNHFHSSYRTPMNHAIRCLQYLVPRPTFQERQGESFEYSSLVDPMSDSTRLDS